MNLTNEQLKTYLIDVVGYRDYELDNYARKQLEELVEDEGSFSEVFEFWGLSESQDTPMVKFKKNIKHEDVEGNRTYLSITVDGCKYGQPYQNTVNSLENMVDNFVTNYYPLVEARKELEETISRVDTHGEIANAQQYLDNLKEGLMQ